MFTKTDWTNVFYCFRLSIPKILAEKFILQFICNYILSHMVRLIHGIEVFFYKFQFLDINGLTL